MVKHEVDEQGITREHGGEEAVVAAEQNNLGRRQQFFTFLDDVSDADVSDIECGAMSEDW